MPGHEWTRSGLAQSSPNLSLPSTRKPPISFGFFSDFWRRTKPNWTSQSLIKTRAGSPSCPIPNFSTPAPVWKGSQSANLLCRFRRPPLLPPPPHTHTHTHLPLPLPLHPQTKEDNFQWKRRSMLRVLELWMIHCGPVQLLPTVLQHLLTGEGMGVAYNPQPDLKPNLKFVNLKYCVYCLGERRLCQFVVWKACMCLVAKYTTYAEVSNVLRLPTKLLPA